MAIILLVGPSGSGKSTAEKELVLNYPETYHKAVSHTTRKPRDGEKDGADYHFASKEHFNTLEKENKFIESTEYVGNKYGVSKEEIKPNKDTIIVVEPNGARQILDWARGNERVIVIYFDIPLKDRIKGMKDRGDNEEKILERANNETVSLSALQDLNIKPDYKVKKLDRNTTKKVHQFIQISKNFQ